MKHEVARSMTRKERKLRDEIARGIFVEIWVRLVVEKEIHDEEYIITRERLGVESVKVATSLIAAQANSKTVVLDEFPPRVGEVPTNANLGAPDKSSIYERFLMQAKIVHVQAEFICQRILINPVIRAEKLFEYLAERLIGENCTKISRFRLHLERLVLSAQLRVLKLKGVILRLEQRNLLAQRSIRVRQLMIIDSKIRAVSPESVNDLLRGSRLNQ